MPFATADNSGVTTTPFDFNDLGITGVDDEKSRAVVAMSLWLTVRAIAAFATGSELNNAAYSVVKR